MLAFPDTFVTMSTEWVCKLLPLVGLGTRDYIKAGHAALVLIENETGQARYFDFGRYVTPDGYGRVRGANTDVELEIPFTAEINEFGQLTNLSEIALWLAANPQKTHGEGRMLTSVCDAIDYNKASSFIDELQTAGSIPYGAFEKNGSNCARFVTDTILAATRDRSIIKALSFNKKFTPSTVGNVEKAAVNQPIFEVYNGEIRSFKGSAFTENIKNYFHKKRPHKGVGSVVQRKLPIYAQQLTGTGSDAWFYITSERGLPKNHFRIRRYNDQKELDFDGVYVSEEFEIDKPYEFTYNSHCQFCHVFQKNKKIRLAKIAIFSPSLLQKVRLV